MRLRNSGGIKSRASSTTLTKGFSLHLYSAPGKSHYMGGVCSKGSLLYCACRIRSPAPVSPQACETEMACRVLVRDRVHVLEVLIRTSLDHPASKLRLLIRIVEIHDGERDTRIAPRVLCFEGSFPGANQDAITFHAHPNR